MIFSYSSSFSLMNKQNQQEEDLDFIFQLSFHKLEHASLLPFVLIRNALLSSQPPSIHESPERIDGFNAHQGDDKHNDVTMLHDDSDEETWLQACFDEADEDEDEDEDNIMDDDVYFGDEILLNSAMRHAWPLPKPQSPQEEMQVSFMDTDDSEQQTIPYDHHHQQSIP